MEAIPTCKQDERALTSASRMPSGGTGTGGGGMVVLALEGAGASLDAGAVFGAFVVAEDLRTGRGLGGMRGR